MHTRLNLLIKQPYTFLANPFLIPAKQYILLPSPSGEGLGVRLYFFLFSLLISFYLLTFAAVKLLAMTYQDNDLLQRISQFFASFCTLSLVSSNNLLTHTQAHLAFNNTFFFLAYARTKRGVTPINKGLLGVSFVRFFMPFPELSLKQFKNEITTILIN